MKRREFLQSISDGTCITGVTEIQMLDLDISDVAIVVKVPPNMHPEVLARCRDDFNKLFDGRKAKDCPVILIPNDMSIEAVRFTNDNSNNEVKY